MACVSGSNIVNDGLVFHFDKENGQKSWKGAPTTNFLTAPLSPQSWSHLRDPNFGFISDEYFIYNGELGKNIPAYRRTLTGTDFRATRFDVPWSAHTQANVSLPLSASIYCRCLSPAPSTVVNINFQGTNSSGSRVDTGTSLPVSTEWTLLSDTRTLSNNGFVSLVNFGMKYYMNGNATPRTWEFMMPQVEQQSFTTPFVNGARLSTASIVDLSPSRKTITAANLTYRQDDTPTFDGTDDFIVTGTPDIRNSSYSISSWVKLSAISRFNPIVGDLQFDWFGLYFNSSNQLIARHRRVSGEDNQVSYVMSSTLASNTWYYINMVFDITAGMRLYVNGFLVASNNNTWELTILSPPRGPQYIGRHSRGVPESQDYFVGEISQVKIYNKALTAAEIKQNFEATRSRYGI